VYKHVSRLGRIAVIALPLLILPVGSWGAEKALPKASPPAQEGLVLSSRDTLLDLYLKGGVVMHIITLCSILALAVLFERLVNLRKKKIVSPQFLEEIRRHWYRREVQEAIAVCKSHDIALSRIVRAGLLRFSQGSREIERAIQDAGRREATLLKKNLGLLAFLASMAPMLGLFGTVLGMIKSFDAIAVHGSGGECWVCRVRHCRGPPDHRLGAHGGDSGPRTLLLLPTEDRIAGSRNGGGLRELPGRPRDPSRGCGPDGPGTGAGPCRSPTRRQGGTYPSARRGLGGRPWL